VLESDTLRFCVIGPGRLGATLLVALQRAGFAVPAVAGDPVTPLAPDDVPPVRGDAGRLGQAILNLVHNAVKFSEPGDRVVIRVAASGDEATVAVSDEGAGIPRADLGRVFERFYKVDRARQRAVGGTGLGLSIVRHVVEAHGGRIGVTSEEGVGSTFTITLPVQGPAVVLATDSAEGGVNGMDPEAAT